MVDDTINEIKNINDALEQLVSVGANDYGIWKRSTTRGVNA